MCRALQAENKLCRKHIRACPNVEHVPTKDNSLVIKEKECEPKPKEKDEVKTENEVETKNEVETAVETKNEVETTV